MKKLIGGILEFRKNSDSKHRETFAKLALGQTPDALFIACSDSRVAVNVFASTNPGDLFVIRNVGNLVSPCGPNGISVSDESEAAAIEFAVKTLNVTDIIICGHSECGAMQALVKGRDQIKDPNLKSWLKHGEAGLASLGQFNPSLEKHNELSQLNVLNQIENIKSYPMVLERIQSRQLRLHAWWFDLASAEVSVFDCQNERFAPFTEDVVNRVYPEIYRPDVGKGGGGSPPGLPPGGGKPPPGKVVPTPK